MQTQGPLAEKISLVILARNRRESLGETLNHLTSFTESVRLILVDNHSEDSTISFVQQAYPQVEILALEENYGSAARNRGVEQVRTPYIAFADDDSWWEEDALRKAVAYFEQYPRLGLIQGKIILHEQEVEPTCERMAASPLTRPEDVPGTSILGFIACGAIVRREAFLAAGGFHTQFGIGGEEELLALDMAEKGWGLAYLPDLIAYHNPSSARNKTRRQQLIVRNHLWAVWLRRSPGAIIAETFPLLKAALSNKQVRTGLREACRGLPWIMRERKRLSPFLEDEVSKLSRSH